MVQVREHVAIQYDHTRECRAFFGWWATIFGDCKTQTYFDPLLQRWCFVTGEPYIHDMEFHGRFVELCRVLGVSSFAHQPIMWDDYQDLSDIRTWMSLFQAQVDHRKQYIEAVNESRYRQAQMEANMDRAAYRRACGWGTKPSRSLFSRIKGFLLNNEPAF